MKDKLWQFIYGPVIRASPDDDNLRGARVMRPSDDGDDFKQDHGEGVATIFEPLAAVNFEGLLDGRPRGEQGPQAAFGDLLFRRVGEHKEADLVILSLPGLKKAVGRREGGDVARIDRRSDGRLGSGGKSIGYRQQTKPEKGESRQDFSSPASHHRKMSRLPPTI